MYLSGEEGGDEGSSYCCVNAAEKDIYFHSEMTSMFWPLLEYSEYKHGSSSDLAQVTCM